MKVYLKDSIISIVILAKQRLKTEAKRLLCQITKVARNQYTLICFVSLLSGTYYARQLNKVVSLNKSLILLSFPNWKEPKLTLPKAVAKANNKGTILAAQKADRLASKPTKDTVEETVQQRQRGRKHKEQPVEEHQEELVEQQSRRKRQKKSA